MLNVIAFLLAAYGTYLLYQAFDSHGFYAIGAILLLAAASGLFLRKSWSQYLVYVLTATIVAEWSWGVWRAYQDGWPSNYTALESVISLIPGLCLIIFCVGSSIVVFKHFRTRN